MLMAAGCYFSVANKIDMLPALMELMSCRRPGDRQALPFTILEEQFTGPTDRCRGQRIKLQDQGPSQLPVVI